MPEELAFTNMFTDFQKYALGNCASSNDIEDNGLHFHIEELLKQGRSVREICIRLDVEQKIVRKIGCIRGRLNPIYEKARRSVWSARSKEIMADKNMRLRLSESHKKSWAERKALNPIPEKLPSYQELSKKEGRYGGNWFGRGWWTPIEEAELEVLCKGFMEIEKVATIIGRAPSALAYHAIDMGLSIPRDWYEVIAQKYTPKLKGIRPDEIKTQYPYIRIKSNDQSHLLEINNLVPKSYPEWMRADICQEILLAVYSGKVNLHTLQGDNGSKLIKQYVSHWRKQNEENSSYGLMSINNDDERSFDEMLGAQSLMDAPYNEINGNRISHDALIGFSPPTQINDIFELEIDDRNKCLHKNGVAMSREEVRELMGQE